MFLTVHIQKQNNLSDRLLYTRIKVYKLTKIKLVYSKIHIITTYLEHEFYK